MYYFMSDIHGNARAYFALKAKIDFGSSDKLYILGNVFDGNSKNPEHCLAILDDIIENRNITLILGDHEYAHVLYHVASEDEVKKELERKVNQLKPSGKPLLDYMKKLPQKKLDRYVSYLLECEMSEIIDIGGKNFYLVHGAPALLSECEGIDKWQEIVATQKIDLKRMYQKEIATDPNNSFGDERNYDDTIIICGNVTCKVVLDSVPEIRKNYFASEYSQYQRIILYNNKMLINCGCQGDAYLSTLIPTLACVSIIENQYSITYNYDIFDEYS